MFLNLWCVSNASIKIKFTAVPKKLSGDSLTHLPKIRYYLLARPPKKLKIFGGLAGPSAKKKIFGILATRWPVRQKIKIFGGLLARPPKNLNIWRTRWPVRQKIINLANSQTVRQK